MESSLSGRIFGQHKQNKCLDNIKKKELFTTQTKEIFGQHKQNKCLEIISHKTSRSDGIKLIRNGHQIEEIDICTN
jgi:hypothetical protein